MDVVEGKALQISDAVYAYQLDGKGVTSISPDALATAEQPCWLHLDYTHPASAARLQNTPLLPEVVRDGLAGECAPQGYPLRRWHYGNPAGYQF